MDTFTFHFDTYHSVIHTSAQMSLVYLSRFRSFENRDPRLTLLIENGGILVYHYVGNQKTQDLVLAMKVDKTDHLKPLHILISSSPEWKDRHYLSQRPQIFMTRILTAKHIELKQKTGSQLFEEHSCRFWFSFHRHNQPLRIFSHFCPLSVTMQGDLLPFRVRTLDVESLVYKKLDTLLHLEHVKEWKTSDEPLATTSFTLSFLFRNANIPFVVSCLLPPIFEKLNPIKTFIHQKSCDENMERLKKSHNVLWFLMTSCYFHPSFDYDVLIQDPLFQIIFSNNYMIWAFIHHLCIFHARDVPRLLISRLIDGLKIHSFPSTDIQCLAWHTIEAQRIDLTILFLERSSYHTSYFPLHWQNDTRNPSIVEHLSLLLLQMPKYMETNDRKSALDYAKVVALAINYLLVSLIANSPEESKIGSFDTDVNMMSNASAGDWVLVALAHELRPLVFDWSWLFHQWVQLIKVGRWSSQLQTAVLFVIRASDVWEKHVLMADKYALVLSHEFARMVHNDRYFDSPSFVYRACHFHRPLEKFILKREKLVKRIIQPSLKFDVIDSDTFEIIDQIATHVNSFLPIPLRVHQKVIQKIDPQFPNSKVWLNPTFRQGWNELPNLKTWDDLFETSWVDEMD